MGFSSDWEYVYQNNQQLSIWPWSDLVSYVKRYVQIHENFNVLELGCGAGANIPFFESLGVNYHGIEGSETIVNQLKLKFPKFNETIIASDFTENLVFKKKFDLIIDRASLTHNDTQSINTCLQLAYDSLTTGGYFIGIDWFSLSHSDSRLGNSVDEFTKTEIQEGQFRGIGNVHFSDKKHLLELFNKFQLLKIEHKVIEDLSPLSNGNVFASWNFIVKKVD
jgi:SAM-dependent methyltransferase